MEVKKGHKKTEIGIIPEDWECLRVEDCVSITTGKKNTEDNIIDGLYPFFVRSQQVEKINSYSFDCEAVLTAGDGVGTGKVFHYINGKFDLHQRVYAMTNYRHVTGKFFYFYFSSFFYNEVSKYTAKSSVDSVRRNMIAKMLILIPTHPEQQVIARALSDVDNLINSLTKLIDKKKNIKQGAMQELLTGKKRLEGFSEKWVKKPLSELFDFSGGYSASRAQLSAEGYCYLHYGDIHGSNKQFIDVEKEYLGIPKLDIQLSKVNKEKMLQDGDVIFVDASEDVEGTSRHIVVINPNNIPYISGLHTIVAKNKKDILDNKFKRYCFQSDDIKKQFRFYAVGIKVSGLSRNTIAKIELCFPMSKTEQTAIANILSDMDAEIEALENKLNKYKSIKQGMMQELLTGRIRLI